jgi:hydrogenase maturation protein HypF
MTFHIHIRGIVQGVGFRPFVYKLAIDSGVKGNVNNTTDGVHINVSCSKAKAKEFLNNLIENAPELSIITGYTIEQIDDIQFDNFQIIHSENDEKPNLLLTPDFALCDDCRKELWNPDNRRFNYPFITCTNCGPRYSIITGLPYDRPLTTMEKYIMCDSCENEYNDPLDRRYYSQTNSCDECGIRLILYENGKKVNSDDYMDFVVRAWKKGKIVALKGIGGFLLTCDATNENVVSLLRERKHRPSKPFALMYPDTEMLKKDCFLSKEEESELSNTIAPVVLLKIMNKLNTNLDLEGINSGLDRIGVMLPYTPLYELLLNKFGKPVIATSGNISNSTIIYSNEKAISELVDIADIILLNDRDIVVPQDDGVVKFSEKTRSKIIIRRSRGMAPTYINPELNLPLKTVIATGASLKSTFCLVQNKNIYISQFLGDTAAYDAQENYIHTLNHFFSLFKLKPDMVFSDKHPDYFSSRYAQELADKYNIKINKIQHHKAHFAAVLAENNLMKSKKSVLGVIFDGTGYGDDGNIWGGEFFIYENNKIERFEHLDYFDFILADKMVMEPRISAFVITKEIVEAKAIIQKKFNDIEWNIYRKIAGKPSMLKSSSIGRLFDAAASLILNIDKQTYEGEAAMKLEVAASNYFMSNIVDLLYSYLGNGQISNIPKTILKGIIKDLNDGENKSFIAAKFHLSIVHYIKNIAEISNSEHIAFSGGVFQNGVIIDLLKDLLSSNFTLYFHKVLSPNDECISFGQMIAGSFKLT